MVYSLVLPKHSCQSISLFCAICVWRFFVFAVAKVQNIVIDERLPLVIFFIFAQTHFSFEEEIIIIKTTKQTVMHVTRIHLLKSLVLLAAVMLATFHLLAQEPDNEFSIDTRLRTRGEIRAGGFLPDSLDNTRRSQFVLGQYRISFNYKRSWLELKLMPQLAGVWGSSMGNLTLAEAWAQVKSKQGLFAKIGRQNLEYDDERILGYDDWTMTAPTHDVIKFGYEGHGHKVHAILAYNQNDDNMEIGSSYYSGGIQPYKTMQTLWYHYDTPKSFYGLSLLAMNIGMQNSDAEHPKTYYQQLFGTYMTLKPKFCSLEGAFYYQMGKEEHGIPIDAFMGSVKVNIKPSDIYTIYSGYDYLSGDKYFAVPASGEIGLVHHDKIRGFAPLFGSHHDFYGAMDFFYTPGLQNLYIGASVNPTKALNIDAAYHFFAITANLDYLKKPLGHEAEIAISYEFVKFVNLSAG